MWIEVHEGLIDHPKTWQVAEILGIKPVQVVGHLVTLWLWALDSAPDGILDVPAIAIARGAHWWKEPSKFVEALLSAGFINRAENEKFLIHDWEDYAGRLIEKRKNNAERVRRFREAHKLEMANVTVTPALLKPLRNGATVPNRTVPNRTVPNRISISTNTEEEKKSKKSPGVRSASNSLITPEFLAEMVTEFETINVDREYKKCRLWWEEHRKKEPAKLALRNWLEKAVKIASENLHKQMESETNEPETGSVDSAITDAWKSHHSGARS